MSATASLLPSSSIFKWRAQLRGGGALSPLLGTGGGVAGLPTRRGRSSARAGDSPPRRGRCPGTCGGARPHRRTDTRMQAHAKRKTPRAHSRTRARKHTHTRQTRPARTHARTHAHTPDMDACTLLGKHLVAGVEEEANYAHHVQRIALGLGWVM